MIKYLPKQKYQDYPLTFTYQSASVFKVIRNIENNEMVLKFRLKKFKKPIQKQFNDKLYAPYYEHAEAYGYYLHDALAGIIELNFETWNKRLRVTECIVFENYLRRGIGRKLIDYAISRAKALKARAIVLETQTSNIRAIRFYQACGFSLIGTDLTAYSNEDVNNDEVRIELGLNL